MSPAFCAAAIKQAIVELVRHLLVLLLGFWITERGPHVLASALLSSALLILVICSTDEVFFCPVTKKNLCINQSIGCTCALWLAMSIAIKNENLFE